MVLTPNVESVLEVHLEVGDIHRRQYYCPCCFEDVKFYMKDSYCFEKNTYPGEEQGHKSPFTEYLPQEPISEHDLFM